MKIRILYFTLVIICLLSNLLSAQEGDKFILNGQVKDSVTGEALVGVNVFLKDVGKGTVTDVQGNYSIDLMSGTHFLKVSYIGYISKEINITVNSNRSLDIFIAPDVTEIEEVTVTAQRRFFGNMEYGREIPTIGAEVIEKQNSSNASDILHARLAGVWATKTSGAPGDHQKIRIRGQSSFFSSAEPLYVIDGVPVPIVNMSSLGIADLNIHDIENVTVLKDASASSLYGFQGGNGVVLIDTKKGGENRINFLTRFGYQWQPERYDLMQNRDFFASLDTALSHGLRSFRSYYPAYSNSLCDHNRQEEIFSSGSVQEYQLSSSGNKMNFNYYLSGNYTDQKGALPQSQYTRYTFSGRLGRLIGNRLAVDLGYRGSWQTNENNQDEYKGNRLIFEGLTKAPCLECTPDSLLYDERALINSRTYYPGYPRLSSVEDLITLKENNHHRMKINSDVLNGIARFRINDYLYMDFMESLMYRHSAYDAAFTYNVYSERTVSSTELMLRSREDVILFNHQANISYSRTFGKHELGAVLAHRYYKDNLWWNVDSLVGTLPEHYSLKNSMAAYGPKGSVLRNLSSYIGHVTYSYNKTCFLSAVANLSHIKEGLYTDYYNMFPSLALSWDVTQLGIFDRFSRFDIFKIYINHGISGNFPLNGLSNDLYQDLPYTINDTVSYDPVVLQLANHHLKHESITETDFGLQTAFLDKRISISAVFYSKLIDNMLILRDIPEYYGGGQQYLNIGQVAIDGYELGIELIPVQRPNLSWHLTFNYSSTSQVVRKLLDNQDLLFIDDDILFPDFIISEGDELGNIYGYRFLGKMSAEDWDNPSNQFVTIQGDKYLNADSTDSELTNEDKIVVGNSVPQFTWNFLSSLQYRNLSIDFVWYAVRGIEKYNATRAASVMTGVNREINDYIADTLRSIHTEYFYESDVFVEDASFIRLKSLAFHYEFKKPLLEKIQWEMGLSFENLLTITKYKGYDPEATTFTDNNFSDNAIDRGAYPAPKAVYLTLNLIF